MAETHEGFQDVVVQKQNVGRLLASFDIRKAMGRNGVSGWTLRECKDQLIQSIWEGTTGMEEGQHSAHLQRRKEDRPIKF